MLQKTRLETRRVTLRAVVQILHGMAEHIGMLRRDCKTAEQGEGFLVVGHNHLGHGEEAEQLGVFGKGGFDSLVEDAHALRLMTQKEYPGIRRILCWDTAWVVSCCA